MSWARERLGYFAYCGSEPMAVRLYRLWYGFNKIFVAESCYEYRRCDVMVQVVNADFLVRALLQHCFELQRQLSDLIRIRVRLLVQVIEATPDATFILLTSSTLHLPEALLFLQRLRKSPGCRRKGESVPFHQMTNPANLHHRESELPTILPQIRTELAMCSQEENPSLEI